MRNATLGCGDEVRNVSTLFFVSVPSLFTDSPTSEITGAVRSVKLCLSLGPVRNKDVRRNGVSAVRCS